MVKLILVLSLFPQYSYSQVDLNGQILNQLDTAVFSNPLHVGGDGESERLYFESKLKFIFTSDGVKGIEVLLSKKADSLILLEAIVHNDSINKMNNSSLFFDFFDGTRIELENESQEDKNNTTEFLVHLHYQSELIKNLIENKLTRIVLFYSDGFVNEYITNEQANLLTTNVVRILN